MVLELALSAASAGVVGLLAGADASRRGRAWVRPAIGVAAVSFVASLSALTAVRSLLSADTAVNGGPPVVATPLELLGLTVAAATVVPGAVLAGYVALARWRHPA